MISTTDQLSFSPRYNRGAQRPVRAVDWNYFVTLMERFCAPMPTEEPFDWAVANLVLDDPEVKGPFNPEGRQYLRDTFGQGYWSQRERFVALLEWLAALGNAEGMTEWVADSEAARILSGRLRNDHA